MIGAILAALVAFIIGVYVGDWLGSNLAKAKFEEYLRRGMIRKTDRWREP